jgi:hypothetical protein
MFFSKAGNIFNPPALINKLFSSNLFNKVYVDYPFLLALSVCGFFYISYFVHSHTK